ncbi:MAG TPA: alpha/beta hydrolase [Thermoanaerobaculia bacterium]
MKTLLFALALWAGPSANATGPSLILHPCHLPGVPDEVRCGTLEVFENRDAGNGRRIALAACREWPAAHLGPDALEPVVSDAPVLVFSGERDPTTPPSNGAAVVSHLKNGRLVIVPHRGHGVIGAEGSGCIVGVIDQLITAGSTEKLDLSCVAKIRAVPFVLPAAK